MALDKLREANGSAARRIALISIGVSATLAISKVLIGWWAGSTSVMADGFESAGDVVTSSVVLFGLVLASRPPDQNHPYGHGRSEMVSGLIVGLFLAAAGVAICVHSLDRAGISHTAPAVFGIWPLIASICAKSVLSTVKFRYGKRVRSDALIADAWNDTVDILSGTVALIALGLAVWNPTHLARADHYGGFAVGLIVVLTGARIVRETSLQLMDTMPDDEIMLQIRAVALEVQGVEGVEKCYARKTGFQYHVDLHLEVDPEVTVRASHEIATQVRIRLKETLEFIADVLVHVEPAPAQPVASRSPE